MTKLRWDDQFKFIDLLDHSGIVRGWVTTVDPIEARYIPTKSFEDTTKTFLTVEEAKAWLWATATLDGDGS